LIFFGVIFGQLGDRGDRGAVQLAIWSLVAPGAGKVHRIVRNLLRGAGSMELPKWFRCPQEINI
jgi:hypothetical protein